MKSNELRKLFLDYFQKNGHQLVSSSSLVPSDDPSLLFTNAGMVQFKEVFLGKKKLSFTRAVTSQKCVRAGGKHNDLENVGFTARHHTFFEMLGNFSFGDYFKREAIKYSWDFLTNILKIPKEKLWVTAHHNDQEAKKIWLEEMKINPQRFSTCGDQDNFWAMGDTGPCGYCSEIFYDHGEKLEGVPPGSGDTKDRYLEVWNLVFMEFERDAKGKLTKLPKPSIDTGMGLERIASVVQGVDDNYDTDLFQGLIGKNSAAIKKWKISDTQYQNNRVALKVIGDHIRSISFLIADGVVPSNEGRGYVLRRIMRRAIRYLLKIKKEDVSLGELVPSLISLMGEIYPELKNAKDLILKIITNEEELFSKTLNQGLQHFSEKVSGLNEPFLSGKIIFELYDTYGFPLEVTKELAAEKGLKVDLAGFEKEMEKQRETSRQSSKFSLEKTFKLPKLSVNKTEFLGYEKFSATAKVIGLIKESNFVETLKEGDLGIVILDQTTFYAESGGQVGDQGIIKAKNAEFVVIDTQKYGDFYLHHGHLKTGKFSFNEKVEALVEQKTRRQIMRNHSVTHLLHQALRDVLGEHVVQKGSYVDSERARFDFLHFQAITSQELKVIELLVNEKIRENLPVVTEITTLKKAKEKGVLALFDEKYEDQVRMVAMGDFSKELCGGTHVKNTGEIALFKIISEGGVAASIRRIEGITGEKAFLEFQAATNQLNELAKFLKTEPELLLNKVKSLFDQFNSSQREIANCSVKMVLAQIDSLLKQIVVVDEINILSVKLTGLDARGLREVLDRLKQKIEKAVIVLACEAEGKIQMISGVSDSLCKKIHAGELMKYLAIQVGGSGGGRPDMAQGGGVELGKLDQALKSVVLWVKERL
jgi:alanyl-tRNA synthetase